MNYPIITLTTDFGTSDHYVAAMKGVILGICPQARLVDISHEIAPYAITEAAFTLSQVWACFPKGTVHLVVVDPGVGSLRRPLITEAAGHLFVAPDNGVLTFIYEASPIHGVREITDSRYFRTPVSQTFHGRDIFAPVAAHLANGISAAEFGESVPDPLRCAFARPIRTGSKTWTGTILKADRFGNLVTNFDSGIWSELVDGPFQMKVGEIVVSRAASNYAAVGTDELFVIAGSAGFLEVSINQKNAATAIGIAAGRAVELQLL